MRLGLALGVLAVLVNQPARDRFVEQRDAAAALNPLSPAFTIAFEGGRRSFRIGERIPIVFSYDYVPNRTGLGGSPYTHFATAVLDRTDGTKKPPSDIYRAGMIVEGGVSGCGEAGSVVPGVSWPAIGGIAYNSNGVPSFILVPPPPPPPPPKPPAIKMTFVLNDGVRFDAPGRYRLYMSDHHEGGYRKPLPPPLISNIIEFEITAKDETWERQTLRDAMAVLDGSADLPRRKEAARALRFLGTRDAIDLMTGRLLNRKFADVSFEFEQGLVDARDRDYVIGVLERQVDDVSQPVSWSHLRTLAALRLTRSRAGSLTSKDRYRAMLAAHHRRLGVLAGAGVLSDRLKKSFEANLTERPPEAPVPRTHVPVGPALATYAKEVEAVLTRFPPPARESVLSAHSMILGDADGFAPMLKRLAAAGSPIAKVLVTDFTAPSDPPTPLDSIDTAARHVSAFYDAKTRRRTYMIAGHHVSFVELGLVFSRFPRGTVLQWSDRLAWHWELDREAEFRRVEKAARRHGLKLNRR